MKRRAAVIIHALYVGAHHGKRSDDPVHGTTLDRCVSIDGTVKGLGSQYTGHEPGGRTTVACI